MKKDDLKKYRPLTESEQAISSNIWTVKKKILFVLGLAIAAFGIWVMSYSSNMYYFLVGLFMGFGGGGLVGVARGVYRL